ncbi:hypothetical protein ACLSYV_03790 [Avibacterium avium]|uniref:hypothetical protein n=1 Tax=Avibacterium avium TaxID=751 RepID=UPI003BF80B47
MKPFNLEKALAGEPVKLRNGRKAYVKYIIDDEYITNYPLRGFIVWKRLSDGNLNAVEQCWTKKGGSAISEKTELDITLMWEEPKPKRYINGIEVPEPITGETWVDGKSYWYVELATPEGASDEWFYIESAIDRRMISQGLVFETKEGAEAMAKALLNYKVEIKGK